MINYLRDFIKKLQKKIFNIHPEIIWFAAVFLTAVVLRMIAWSMTPMIAPDGVVYITQAKAIFYDQWEVIVKCGGFRIFSIYPILIAAGYSIFSDWVFTGKIINLTFGIATVIPLYLILRQFFDYKISSLATLVFAVNPFFIGASIDILRGPICWFFLVLGLYFFVARIKKESRFFLVLSSLSFLLAAWTRIEAILFFVMSFAYLLYKDRNIRKSLTFIFPAIIIFAFAFLFAYFKNISVNDLQRVNEGFSIFSNSLTGYFETRSKLKGLANGIDGVTQQALKLFLVEARTNIWLVALGTLINRVLEVFLYLFFIPFIVGFVRLKDIKRDPRLVYLISLIVTSLALLYFSIFYIWVMESRYLALFIFPSFVFAGIGFKSIVEWLRKKLTLKYSITVIILSCLVFLCAMPKNIKPRHYDKVVYKEIGEFIARKEKGNNQAINVSASIGTQRYVSFYTNLNFKGTICHGPSRSNCWEFFAKDNSFVEQLKSRKIKYLLWTEKTLSNYNLDITKYSQHFRELGRWKHKDTGKMILFEII